MFSSLPPQFPHLAESFRSHPILWRWAGVGIGPVVLLLISSWRWYYPAATPTCRYVAGSLWVEENCCWLSWKPHIEYKTWIDTSSLTLQRQRRPEQRIIRSLENNLCRKGCFYLLLFEVHLFVVGAWIIKWLIHKPRLCWIAIQFKINSGNFFVSTQKSKDAGQDQLWANCWSTLGHDFMVKLRWFFKFLILQMRSYLHHERPDSCNALNCT